ncbi:hypothetical protein SESBI_05680 [Sesbania bispinosa]|nr:hypothetical protein SESBI_05680 [Sesbania bispinosa]
MALVPACVHNIKSLCGWKENWRLVVKLVRVWKMSSVAAPHDPYATQMVFLDQEGSRIEATIQKHHMLKFAHAGVEGEVYKVANFGLMRNVGKFQAASHDFKLILNASTKMVPCPNYSIPCLGLSLVKTSDIVKTNWRSEYLLDFMGVLLTVSEEMILSKEGRKTRLMLLDLVDDMGQIHCALFGDLIDVVSGYLSQSNIGLPVVVIQLARVNFYKGGYPVPSYVYNYFLIPRASWLAVHEVESDVRIGTIKNRPRPLCMREEFLKMYPKKSLGQFLETLEEGFFVLLGMVSEIVHESLWWYMACPCMKAVSYAPGVPYCEYCQTIVLDLTPRYKLKMVVSDGVDSAQFILFDSEYYAMLNKPCRELVSHNKCLQLGEYPREITDLVGREFLFQVEKKDDIIFGLDESYKVKRVCCDIDLKFAPAFSKIGSSDAPSGHSSETPETNSIVTILDVSPEACGQSSTTHEDFGDAKKIKLEGPVDGPAQRPKRGKVKAAKQEKP